MRPLRLYAWQTGQPASILYAETSTELLDTEGLGLLRCRFARAAATAQPADAKVTTTNCLQCLASSCTCTEAEYLSRALLRCPVPNFGTTGPVTVDVTVDGGASYSAPAAGQALRV